MTNAHENSIAQIFIINAGGGEGQHDTLEAWPLPTLNNGNKQHINVCAPACILNIYPHTHKRVSAHTQANKQNTDSVNHVLRSLGGLLLTMSIRTGISSRGHMGPVPQHYLPLLPTTAAVACAWKRQEKNKQKNSTFQQTLICPNAFQYRADFLHI